MCIYIHDRISAMQFANSKQISAFEHFITYITSLSGKLNNRCLFQFILEHLFTDGCLFRHEFSQQQIIVYLINRYTNITQPFRVLKSVVISCWNKYLSIKRTFRNMNYLQRTEFSHILQLCIVNYSILLQGILVDAIISKGYY